MTAYAWFVWHRAHIGPPTIEWTLYEHAEQEKLGL